MMLPPSANIDYDFSMLEQPTFPWPGAHERCPKCKGSGDVYYLHAAQPGVDVAGGKRVECPVCIGTGSILVPVQRKLSEAC